MAYEHFIPTVWSGQINQALDKSLVFGKLCTAKYEGDIKGAGDSVRIVEIGLVEASTYTKNSTTVSYSALDDAAKTLVVDQVKYFSFYLDDVDRALAIPGLMEEGMRKGAYALADAADTHIGTLYSQAGTTTSLGTTGTPLNMSSGTALQYIALCGRRLDDNNVPRQGRWLVVPPFMHLAMVLQELTAVISPNAERLVNGFIGHWLGFDIYISNNCAKSGTTYSVAMAGIPGAIAFASKLLNVETVRLTEAYGDGVRGLYVYGAKVVVNDALAAVVVVDKTV